MMRIDPPKPPRREQWKAWHGIVGILITLIGVLCCLNSISNPGTYTYWAAAIIPMGILCIYNGFKKGR